MPNQGLPERVQPIAQSHPRSPVTEAYRTLRTNIQFASAVNDVKVLLITSSLPSEGKTSTASNLAVVAAQGGKRVILIDADLRKPQVHQRFQVSNLDGLSSVLIREKTLEECVVQGETEGLYLLPSGPIPPNPSEILSSQRFADLITTCQEQYDLIILDAPPVLSVSDALVLSRVAGGVVLVINTKSTPRNTVIRSTNALRQVNANLLGVVLNKIDQRKAAGYYYYYYSSYGQTAKM